MRSWYAAWDSSSPMSNLSATAPPFTVASPSAPSPDSAQIMDSGDPLRFTVSSSLNSRVSPNPIVSVPDWLSSPIDPVLDTVNYAGENPYSTYPYGDLSGGSRNVTDVGIYYPQHYFPELDSDKPLNFANHPSYDDLSASRVCAASGSAYNDKTNSFSRLISVNHVSSDVCSEETNRGWHELTPFWSALNSKDDGLVHRSYEHQGAHSFEGFGASTEASNNFNVLNRGYCAVTSNELVNVNLFPGNNTEVLIDSPPTALSGSTSVLSQAYSSAPPLDYCVEPRNYKMGYSDLVDKCSGEHFSGQGNGYSVIDTNLSGARPLIAAKVPERNFLFGATQNRSGQGEKIMGIQRFHFGNGDYLQNEKVVSGDASDRLSPAAPKLEVPCMVVDGLNVAHESNHAFSSSENVSEAFSHYGHTVDSPCWKGVSIKRFDSSKACEIVGPNHVSEFKDINSLNPQNSQVFAENDDCGLNIFSQRRSELTRQDKNLNSGKNSAIPVEQTEGQHSSGLGVGFGDVQEVGPCYLRPSYSCRGQGSEDVNGPWKRNVSIDKLAGDVSVKLSTVKRNSYGHDVTSKEKQQYLVDGSDVDRKINEAIDVGLSDVSMRCVEHVLSSPPTMEASAEQSYFHGEELAPRMDVSLLVKTMLNLSELILRHNSNGTSDLKEPDYVVLKKVANNLETCCLKDVELAPGSRETSSSVPDAPPLFHGESLQCQKNEEPEQQVGSSRGIDDQERPASVTNAAENMQSSLGGMLKKEGSSTCSKLPQIGMVEGTQLSNQKEQTDAPCNSEKHSVLPGLPEDDNFSNLTHRGIADFLKQDKITQDIKRILMENFHDEVGSEPQTHLFKNLWLEAEAALCSVNYMARYNHAKLCMVNSKPENEKDAYENAMPILTNLCNDDKSNLHILRRRSTDATDDVMDRFNILKARDRDPDYITADDVQVEHQSPKASDISPLQNSVPHSDNIERSSVMERLSILKQRLDDTIFTKSDDLATTDDVEVEHQSPKASNISPLQNSVPHSDNIERSSVMERLSFLNQRLDDTIFTKSDDLATTEDIEVEHQSPKASDISPLQNSVPYSDNIERSSVMERLSILKQRLDDTIFAESDDLATRVLDIPANQPSDTLERSVLARFSVLKQRDDIASLRRWNLAALEAIHLESAVSQDYISETCDSVDESTFSGYSLLPQDAECSVVDGTVVEPSTASSVHPCAERTRSSSLDGSPLEWEHVQREEVVAIST